MHDHIFNLMPRGPGLLARLHTCDGSAYPEGAAELKELKDAGYDTIFELSFCGRCVTST